MRSRIAAVLAAVLAPTAGAFANADIALSLVAAGREDYYCTYDLAVTNTGTEGIDDINGVVEMYVGERALERSFAASFLDVAPGETVTARFRAPHEPCDDIDAIVFVVNGCRVGRGFLALDACVARLAPDASVKGVISR